MDVRSFHCENPLWKSGGVSWVVIGGVFLMWSGIMKEVRNSRRSASFPYQCWGIKPERRSVARGERLVNVSWS